MSADAVWLNPKGAAARAGVSVPTVLRAARHGALEGHKVSGLMGKKRLWRFRPQDVDDWITRSTTPVLHEVSKGRRTRGAA